MQEKKGILCPDGITRKLNENLLSRGIGLNFQYFVFLWVVREGKE